MSWIFVALSAYFLLAIANLGDKFLVDNVLKNSKAYAFVACVLGALVFVVSPWFLEWPGFLLFSFNLINGFIFAIALWFLYEALRRGEASRVLVFIGGLTPVFSLFFSFIIFKEKFLGEQLIGLFLMLVGVFLIAFLPTKRSWLSRVVKSVGLSFKAGSKNALFIAAFSAFSYSLYFISTKIAYSHQEFISAFIWTRLGAALFVLLFLFSLKNRLAIIELFSSKGKKKNNFLVFLNQIIGSSGFILQNYAIFLGSVVLVNALQGVQYAFLLIISAVIALWRPKLLKETFSKRIVFQKSLAVIFIGLGLYFLTF